jgi:hypothetical protein
MDPARLSLNEFGALGMQLVFMAVKSEKYRSQPDRCGSADLNISVPVQALVFDTQAQCGSSQ